MVLCLALWFVRDDVHKFSTLAVFLIFIFIADSEERVTMRKRSMQGQMRISP